MSPRTLVVVWTIGIVIWVVICAGGWVVATRDDYARLRSASLCYSSSLQPQSTAPQCANTKPSDLAFYKAVIDRKAAISRVAGALGAMVAIGALILVRGRAGNT